MVSEMGDGNRRDGVASGESAHLLSSSWGRVLPFSAPASADALFGFGYS